MPVPVHVPVYEFSSPHPPHPEDEFEGYDYTHPHIQYRKDVEELREWGIEPNEEPYEEQVPLPGNYPTASPYAHNLAYSGYVDDLKTNRRGPTVSINSVPGVRQSPGDERRNFFC